MATGIITLSIIFIVFVLLNVIAIKNKNIGKHIILLITILGVYSALNIPSRPPAEQNIFILIYIITATFSMISLLILVPNNAKAHQMKPATWAIATFFTGPIAAIIYYIISLKKE